MATPSATPTPLPSSSAGVVPPVAPPPEHPAPAAPRSHLPLGIAALVILAILVLLGLSAAGWVSLFGH